MARNGRCSGRRRLLWAAFSSYGLAPQEVPCFSSTLAFLHLPAQHRRRGGRGSSPSLSSAPAERHQRRRLGSRRESDGDDLEAFRKSYRLNGVGTGSRVALETDTGHVLRTDVPAKMGGGDTAPQPVETLLAALCGCTQATAVYVGRQMKPRVLVERLEFVDVVAHRDERGALSLPIDVTPTIPARLQSIEGTIRVFVRNTSTNRKQQSFTSGTVTSEQLTTLAEQTEARCPVANMIVASGSEMNVQWVLGDYESPSTNI